MVHLFWFRALPEPRLFQMHELQKIFLRRTPQIQRQLRHITSATFGNHITPRFQQATAFVASGTSVNHVRRRVCGKANFMQMPAAAFAGNEKRTRMPFTLDRGLSPRLFSSWVRSFTCLASLFFSALDRRYSANIRACCAYQPFITTILVIV